MTLLLAPSAWWLAMPSSFGEAIAERREVVGFTNQTDLVAALDKLLEGYPAFQKFSQQWLSRLERDRNGDIISSAHGPKLRALAHALQWSMADLQKATGVDLGVPSGWTVAGSVQRKEKDGWTISGRGEKPFPDDIGPAQALHPVPEVHRVPVIALASAEAPVDDTSDQRIIGWEYPDDEQFRSHMLVLEVDGESMNNGNADSLQHGDRLYVDTRDLMLQDGKIYIVHVHGNGIVVKRARRLGADWWLFSDNSQFEPTRPDMATIIGRVYFHQPRGKKL